MWIAKPPAGIQLNRNHPLASGLVGCWLFNEGNGLRVNDLSGYNNHGTLTNFEPFTSTSGWTGGINGNALQFDGTNDYVDVGNNKILNIQNDVTVEIWVKPNIGTMNVSPFTKNIIEKGNLFVSTYAISYVGDTDKIRVGYWDGVAFNSLDSDILTVTRYYHVVYVLDKINISMYFNGILRQIPKGGNPIGNSVTVKIGAQPTRPFNGTVSKICIWNRALSSVEVQKLYVNPYEMFKSPEQ